MIRLAAIGIPILITLTGCTTSLATCGNARAAAMLATAAMARICPMR
jgi:hypothetical protein